jgi:hypothetical protein
MDLATQGALVGLALGFGLGFMIGMGLERNYFK